MRQRDPPATNATSKVALYRFLSEVHKSEKSPGMPRFFPFDSRLKGLKGGEPCLSSAAKMGAALYWIAQGPNSVDSHFKKP
jgi:hypothetical protein